MTLSFRVINKIKPPVAQLKIIRSDLQTELKPLLKQHIDGRNAAVANFKNQPKFGGRVAVGDKQVEIQVILENPAQKVKRSEATIKSLVRWIFKTGTQAHKIFPKRVKWLKFPWGGPGSYDRKLKVSGARGSGEVRGAKTTRAKSVDHPGFERTEAFENINKKLNPQFIRRCDRGIKRGLRRLGSKK